MFGACLADLSISFSLLIACILRGRRLTRCASSCWDFPILSVFCFLYRISGFVFAGRPPHTWVSMDKGEWLLDFWLQSNHFQTIAVKVRERELR